MRSSADVLFLKFAAIIQLSEELTVQRALIDEASSDDDADDAEAWWTRRAWLRVSNLLG